MTFSLNNILAGKKTLPLSLAGSVIAALVLARIDGMIAGESGAGIVYLQFAFTRFNFETIIASWGRDGVNLFLGTIWIDYLYPIAYSLMLSSILARLGRNISEAVTPNVLQPNRFIMVPFIAAFLDYIENSLHVVILYFRIFNEGIIMASSVAAALKWAGIIVVLIVIMVNASSLRKKRMS